MLARKRIDIGRATILRELLSPVPGSRDAYERRIHTAWGADHALVTLSVRSAWDLYLTARAWPEGAEIVMSGANVPDMASIARHHGLRVRAVDFELAGLTPATADFAAAINARTRAIVFAHLFGSRIDLTDIARLAHRHGIDLVEDAAQAFDGRYRGHEGATMSMFSFGPIKTATALGGGVSTVRDAELAARMRTLLAAQPIASAGAFRRRLARYFMLVSITGPRMLRLVSRHLERHGRDLDDLARSARSFAGRELMHAIRERPSRPLLRLLARRLCAVTDMASRAAIGCALADRLRDRVIVPARQGAPHHYWVFPILCDNPAEVVTALRAHGFDATQNATLAPIADALPRLEAAFARIVYLPFAGDYPATAFDRIVALVRAHASGGIPEHQHRDRRDL
ncbi:MAG: aminotransferase class V-fold PLP-dependent enzyme [Planctomycetes bacterium]|nr:aminotransferase class V-fold PLP-dependent enzyme [Planctomycetota bacterium]